MSDLKDFDPSRAVPTIGGKEFDPTRAQPVAQQAGPSVMDEAKRIGGDTVKSLAKGAIAVPESIVGIGDMVTGGAIGKLAEQQGFTPKAWKDKISATQSPELQAQQAKVQAAQGFVPTVKAAIENPATIWHSAMESVPSTLAGAAVGRAAAARGLGAHAAAGLGEGVVTAGNQVEQIRQETPGGTLTPAQIALGAGSGVVTGLIGAGSGKIAGKLGLNDVDEMLIGGAKTPVTKGMIPRVGIGMATEGALEELPQSAQEQMATNIALGKDPMEGVGNAAAMGALTGAGMGGAANIRGPLTRASAEAQAQEQARQMPIKSQEAATARANAMTTETGVPHEVVPHPTVGGAFAVQPAQGDGNDGRGTGGAAAAQGGVGAAVRDGDAAASGGAAGAQVGNAGGAAPVGQEPARPGANGADQQSAVDTGAGSVGSAGPVIGPLTDAATAAPSVPNGTVPEGNDVANPVAAEHYSNVGAVNYNFPLDLRMDSPFDEAAHSAANSPLNDRSLSSPAQQDANNAKLGSAEFQGLPIRIENPQGSERAARPDAPEQWRSLMTEHYGYIAGTKGMDGDPVDVFVGGKVDSPKAFVIDQMINGQPDEHKVMLGFDTKEAAQKAYYDNYQQGWKGGEAIHETTVDDLKKWLKEGDTSKPFGPISAGTQAASQPADVGTQPAATPVSSSTGDAAGTPASAVQATGMQSEPSVSSAPLQAGPEAAQSPSESKPGEALSQPLGQQPAALGSAPSAASNPSVDGLPSGEAASGSLETPDKVGAKDTTQSLVQDTSSANISQSTVADQAVLQDSNEASKAVSDKVMPAAPKVDMPSAFASEAEARQFNKDNGLSSTPVQHPSGEGFALVPKLNPNPLEQRHAEARVTSLNAAIKEYGTQVQAVHQLTPEQSIVKRIAQRAFGSNITIVSANPVFDGVAHDGKVFISENAKGGVLIHTAFHELKHVMQQTNRPLAARLEKFVMGYVNGGLVEQRAQFERDAAAAAGDTSKLDAQGERDEVMADINGALALDPKFWSEMAKHDESLFRKVAYKFMELLTKAVQVGQDSRYNISSMVTDVAAVREAIAKGWAEYNKGRDQSKAEAKTKTALSRKDDDGKRTLPTRVPTGKGSAAPLSDMQIADYSATRSDEKHFAKLIEKIAEVPGMQSVQRDSVEATAEATVQRLTDNLLYLYDQVPQAQRERTQLWYDGARKIAEKWADKYDITPAQASGMLAVLSPQKDWYMNVTMAERILDTLTSQQKHVFDEKMRASAFSFLTKEQANPEDKRPNLDAFRQIKNLSLAATIKRGNPVEIGIWLRAYDESHNSSKHTQVTPEGNFTGDAGNRAWGSFKEIGKAASIFKDGSPENISRQLGGNHKVRNFYNNIYAPNDARFATIDTHAVAAAHLLPLAASDEAVKANFSGPKSAGTGVNGTYPIYFEAYERAAKERGILPRQMQSVTWEAVRGLFTDTFKTKENKATAAAIWNQVDEGKKTVAEARAEIEKMAGGINQPTWYNANDVISDKSYVAKKDTFAGAKITFEVAPDPRNADLKDRWDKLSTEDKQAISQEVAFEIASKALATEGERAKGELHTQFGGWMDDTNPSMSIWLDKYMSSSEADRATRLLGYALDQQSMLRTSPQKFAGAFQSGTIQIEFPHEMDFGQVQALWTQLRGIKDENGEPLLIGHTTSAKSMIMLVDDDKAENLAERIAGIIDDSYNVTADSVWAAFPEKGEDDYGLSRAQADSGSGPDASLRAIADQLRAEAQARIDEAVSRAEEGKLDYSGKTEEGLKGKAQLARTAPDTPEFKKWFGDSKVAYPPLTQADRDAIKRQSNDVFDLATKYDIDLNVVDDVLPAIEAKIGQPIVMYHGTARDIETFLPKQASAIFVTDSPVFAGQFSDMSKQWMNEHAPEVLPPKALAEAKAKALADMKVNFKDDFGYGPRSPEFRGAAEAIRDNQWKGTLAEDYMSKVLGQYMPSGENILPLYVKAENPFDYENEQQRMELGREVARARDLEDVEKFARQFSEMIEQGDWDQMERWDVQQSMKKLGHDSFYMVEGGQRNLAVYSPNQLKSATGNNGDYDPAKAEIALARKPPAWIAQAGLTPELAEKVGAYVPGKTVKQRWQEMRTGLGDKLTQAMFDQYAPIKKLDLHSYMLARMTKSVDGAVEAMLDYGKVGIDGDGALTTDMTGGFKRVLAQLQGEQDRFFAWVAGNRSEALKAQGRENLFDDVDIAALKGLNQGRMKDGTSRAILYAKMNRELQAYNNSVLDVAEKTGVIDPASRAVWAQQYYVPFFRLSEDDETFTPSNVAGLTNVKGITKLKGGTNNLGDLMQNTVLNWNYLLSAALKNQASTLTLRNAELVGAAQQISGAMKGSVFTLDQGRKVHWQITDPALATAVGSISFTGIRGPVIDAASAMKRALSFGVTFSPSYRIRNIIRDQLQAIAVNPMSYNVAANLVNGLRYSSKDNPLYAQMLASGGLIRMGSSYEDNRAAHLKSQIAKLDPDTVLDTQAKVKSVLARIFDTYMETGERAEAATRMAIGKQALADGATNLEAAYLMRDSMDFSLQGSATAVRVLAQVVPFFNARMQGMYKLGRGAMEDKARFATVLGATTAATIALMMANAGDPDWDTREEWDRNNYWWFKVGGLAYRIPKPFELGAMATIAERGVEMVMSGMGKTSRDRFAKQVWNVLMDNLSMNPMPQIVKPAVEVFANKDTFRNRAIESMGDERLSKNERSGPGTTQTAKVLARGVNAVTSAIPGGGDVLSPKQVDYMIAGYFGWLGSHLAAAADFALRPMMGAPEKATRKLDDTFVIGDWVKELPSNQSRFVTDFYDQAKQVQQAMSDINHYKKLGDRERVQDLIAQNKELLQNKTAYTEKSQVVARINTRLKQIDADTKMSAGDKRQEINRLNTLRNKIAQTVVERTTK